MSHPAEQDLALYATRDLTFFSSLTVARHVRNCPACAETVAEYREITAELANATPQIEDWDILATEMRANISLGLEAGACLPTTVSEVPVSWFSPRLAVAMASLMILAAAGVALRPDQPKPTPTVFAQQSVKVDTAQQSVKVDTAQQSVKVDTAQQSVKVDTAQQSVKVDTEGVTITNVYME